MGDSHWHNISVPLFGPRRQPQNGLNYLKLFQSQESYKSFIVKNISLGQHLLIVAILEIKLVLRIDFVADSCVVTLTLIGMSYESRKNAHLSGPSQGLKIRGG